MQPRTLLPHIRRATVFMLLFLLLSASLPLAVHAAVPEAPNLPDHAHAQAAIVYNLDHKEVLFEKNADKLLFPASTVKIMTGFLASERLKDRMDEQVTITEEMLTGVSGNRMKLVEGETIRIRDLFYGAICGGYNDAATALAVLSSGSVEQFVAQMNEKALTFGMYDTVYQNPTGLHTPSMVTTARDTLVLSLAASTDDLYMEASSAVKHEIPATNKSAARTFYNRNYLIASAVTTEYHNPYAEGLNGGMTDEGGWCVATKAFRNDLSWYCVVLGGEEDPESGELYAYSTANALLSWAARGYTVKSVATAGEAFGSIPVAYAALGDTAKDGLPLVAKSDLTVFIPQNALEGERGLEFTVRLTASSLEAPVSAGAEVGVLIFTWNGTEVGRVPLITERAIERNDFTYLLSQMKALPKSRVFQGSTVSFVILLLLYVTKVPRFRDPRKRRAGVYVPAPFRDREDTVEETAKETVTVSPARRSDASPSRRPTAPPPAPPRDPYASAASELERRRKRK